MVIVGIGTLRTSIHLCVQCLLRVVQTLRRQLVNQYILIR